MIEDTIKVKVREGVLQPACVLLVTIEANRCSFCPQFSGSPWARHMRFHLLCISLSHFICLCNYGSGEEISRVLGQSSSFCSETGAAHPNGPPSQPHTLHRSQVTNSNHPRLWRIRINMYLLSSHLLSLFRGTLSLFFPAIIYSLLFLNVKWKLWMYSWSSLRNHLTGISSGLQAKIQFY